MRVSWVACSLSILISMGVCLIIFGQQKLLARLDDQNEEIQFNAGRLNNGLDDRVYQKDQLEKQLEEERKSVLALEAEVSDMAPEEETKKAETEACNADKTKKDEELAGTQTEHDNTEATFKTERESWTGEITTLKQGVEQRSAVCDFLKKDSLGAEKLCPPKAADPAAAQPEPPKDAGAPNAK